MRWMPIPVAVLLLYGGCAVEYGMRIHRFESPEAQGRAGSGGVTFGVPTVHALVIDDWFEADPLDPDTVRFDGENRAFDIGCDIGVAERWDVTLKTGLPYLPFAVGGKYQIFGQPRATATPGNVSLAATVAPGLYTFDEYAGGRTAEGYIGSLDASLIAGYRITDWLLAYGGPYATYHDAFDVEIRDAGEKIKRSGDGRQLGVHLGLRFEAKHFVAMVEAAWSDARWEGLQDDAFALGVTIGFQW